MGAERSGKFDIFLFIVGEDIRRFFSVPHFSVVGVGVPAVGCSDFAGVPICRVMTERSRRVVERFLSITSIKKAQY